MGQSSAVDKRKARQNEQAKGKIQKQWLDHYSMESTIDNRAENGCPLILSIYTRN